MSFQSNHSRAKTFTRKRVSRMLLTSVFCLLSSLALASFTGCTPKAPAAPIKPPDNFAQVVPVFDAALISLQVGDDGNAGKLLPQVTQMAPQEPAGWANLGLFRLRQGAFDAARDALTKAQSMAPKNGQIEALFGLLEGRQGHFAEAVAHLKSSVALAPENLRVRYALIEAIRQQGGATADADAQAQLDELQKAARIICLFCLRPQFRPRNPMTPEKFAPRWIAWRRRQIAGLKTRRRRLKTRKPQRRGRIWERSSGR